MKTWKARLRRGFALFLALTMCLSMLQLTALAADENSGNGTANHTHHAEGWICTPYCSIPEHTHTEDCYHMAENEELARTPVTLPDDRLVEDGTSTERDDFGNEYAPPEYIGPEENPSEDEGEPGEDGGFAVGGDDGIAVDGDDDFAVGGDDEDFGVDPSEGDDSNADTDDNDVNSNDGDNGETANQPEENSSETENQPEEASGETGNQSESQQNDDSVPVVFSDENGSTIIPEGLPAVPQAGVPELQCEMEEHKHTDACGEKEDGGWFCVPDTNITINVPEGKLAAGRVDLLEGVTATPAYCGNWPVQIAVASVTVKESADAAESTEVEPEDGQWLEMDGGKVYEVEYVAYLDSAMAASTETDAQDMPTGLLGSATREVEVEDPKGAAKIDDNYYETLADALKAVKNGDTVELLKNVDENVLTIDKSYTLDMKGHVLTSGEVGKSVVNIVNGTVTIQNGIITGGDCGSRLNQDGKGVFVSGADVTLVNCEITGNKGGGSSRAYDNNSTWPKDTWPAKTWPNSNNGFGGGIGIFNGTLTLDGCTVSDNNGSSKGGGIYAENSAVTVTNSKLTDNTTGSGTCAGGGIAMVGGTLTVDGSEITGNSASNGQGNALGLSNGVTTTIKNSTITATASGSASVIYVQYGKNNHLNMENVEVVNKAGASTLYSIYFNSTGIFMAKDCTFRDSNGSIYLMGADEKSFTNCQFLNNTATYSTAGAPLYLKAGNVSLTDCTFTGNTGYHSGAVYIATTGTVTMDGCLFNQNSGTYASSAGAIYAATGSKTTVTNTVVKENTTAGTNSSGPAGGISINGSSTTFTMTSGAVYGNKSTKQTTPANDVYIYSSAKADILAGKDMKDGDVDFSSYAWSDLSRQLLDGKLTTYGNWTATPAPEYAASIGETKYKTLDDGFKAARQLSRDTGEVVTLEVAEGYIPQGTYWGVTSGKYPAHVNIHLNNTNIYGINSIKNSYSISADNTLTFSGTGTVNKKVYMMGGTLNLDGNVVISGGTLSFNQASIYDNKSATTKVNINGNPESVQIALYAGTVTVSETGHPGKIDAMMTATSGTMMATNFVMNGEVDELNLTQATNNSTALLNGRIENLTLKLATPIYGNATFPKTVAGDNFSVGMLNVSPPLIDSATFDAETGRTSAGLVSSRALRDPSQKVADFVLIENGGGKVSNAAWTSSNSFKHTDGKDYKFLTTVESVGDDIVLHKTVVDGNFVFLGGTGASDSNPGTDLNHPVATFEKAKTLLTKDINVIHILGTVTISGTETWDLGDGQKVESFPTFNGTLVKVPSGATLNLDTVTIDGKGITRSTPLIENNGTLNITGAKITGGVNSVIYSPNNGNGVDGGAVHNSGTLTMTGGEISNNKAYAGGGVFSDGTFNLNGGTIANNSAYSMNRIKVSMGGSLTMNSAAAGGGVFLAKSSTMNMAGGVISGNTSCVGGGIALGNETNAYISYGGPKLTMTGGTISENTAGQGGGIFIQEMCEATINGGSIIGNQATGSFSVATGIRFLYGGGGIYVNGGTGMTKKDGKLTLNCVAITGNTAAGEGAGISGCPSANIDVNLNDGGVVAGNTISGSGKPYDVHIFRGTIVGPNGSNHSGGVKFSLSKYMLGGALYNWTHFDTNERVFFQDISYQTTKTGGFYADVKADVISAAAKKCGVTISGNYAATSGGGIGTNGEVHIGKDPNLNDFFDILVNKEWKKSDGTDLTQEEMDELMSEVTEVVVDLERRVVNTNQADDANWELVDSRHILPGEDGFWAMERPFTNLLKVLDGRALEYRVHERASLTGVWSAPNDGYIEVVTPAITVDKGHVEVIGEVQTPGFSYIFDLYKASSLKGHVDEIESVDVTLTDITNIPYVTYSASRDYSDGVSKEGKTVFENGFEIIIDDQRLITINNLNLDGKFKVSIACHFEDGNVVTIENSFDSGFNPDLPQEEDSVNRTHFKATVPLNWKMLLDANEEIDLTEDELKDIAYITVMNLDDDDYTTVARKDVLTSAFNNKNVATVVDGNALVEAYADEVPVDPVSTPEDNSSDDGNTDTPVNTPIPEEKLVITVGPDPTGNAREVVTVDHLNWEKNYAIIVSLKGEDADGTPYLDKSQTIGVTAQGAENGVISLGQLTNYVNEPSLTLKKILDKDLTGEFTFTIEFDVKDENGNKTGTKSAKVVLNVEKDEDTGVMSATRTVTDVYGATTGPEPINLNDEDSDRKSAVLLELSRDTLKTWELKPGTKFTVTENEGKWSTNWTVENAAPNQGLKSTASGTLCYGENTVTFTNHNPDTLQIPVKKTIKTDGAFKTIPDFQFELKYVGSNAKDLDMPTNTKLIIKGSDFADGKLTVPGLFDSIKFNNDGMFDFTVTEIGSEEGWKYNVDENEWTVKVTVDRLNDGSLKARITSIENQKDETAEAAEFTNSYEPTTPPPPTTPDPDPGPGPGPNPPPTPEVPVDNPPPPLTDLPDPNDPDSPEEVTVIEEDVPKTYVKVWDPEEEEYVYVPEEEVPLGDVVPKTGDSFSAGFWTVLCLTSAAGLAVLTMTKSKKEEEMS